MFASTTQRRGKGQCANGYAAAGAVWLLGSVLAGGAGFGRWRKRKAKNAMA